LNVNAVSLFTFNKFIFINGSLKIVLVTSEVPVMESPLFARPTSSHIHSGGSAYLLELRFGAQQMKLPIVALSVAVEVGATVWARAVAATHLAAGTEARHLWEISCGSPLLWLRLATFSAGWLPF